MGDIGSDCRPLAKVHPKLLWLSIPLSEYQEDAGCPVSGQYRDIYDTVKQLVSRWGGRCVVAPVGQGIH
eukprot:2513402-Alexandrium_andersonii.AAC.1